MDELEKLNTPWEHEGEIIEGLLDEINQLRESLGKPPHPLKQGSERHIEAMKELGIEY